MISVADAGSLDARPCIRRFLMASHFDEIVDHERRERSIGGITALVVILAAVTIVIGIITSVL
jgi:hypothetical protein